MRCYANGWPDCRIHTAADRDAGYRYDLSILQVEFSLTQMLDKPVSGRVFFEQVIRDNLDIGRPDQVALIFDRRLMRRGPRATPGPFRTRVITDGVTPSLHIDYKHTRIKQYHKQGRALRTETTINDTTDFSIGKRLTNLPALREIGYPANRRLLRVQSISHDPITGTDALYTITAPVTTATGARIPACAWVNNAATPCSPPYRCSGYNPTDSPTRTSAPPSPTCGPPAGPGHRRADHLRPAPVTRPRPDHPHTAHPPIPSPTRPAHRDVPVRHPRPIPADRLGPPHRPNLPTTAPSRPRIPASTRNLTITTRLAA